jgi:hypothetical protein
MALRFSKQVAYLEDACDSDEAEPLLEWLLEHPSGKVNLKTCRGLHSAVLQVLLAAHPVVTVKPEDQAIACWLPTPFGEAK